MKQISQNYKNGQIRIEDVNPPLLKKGGILVQTRYSVISIGTESMKVKEGKMSYLSKAKARPDQVKKIIHSVQQQGLISTYDKVMNRLDSLTALGYSLSGVVTAVHPDADEFHVGQRVACAGAGYANHAEINFVPKNLVVPAPDSVAMEHAAFATIGAIAMQGFRRAEMQLGENACVIGLGLLGQLTLQILVAAGIQVIGVDLLESRCRLAEKLGAKVAATPTEPGLLALINRITDGIGIDCIFITASGSSNVPVELAAEMARDRGRVVDVGKTKLDLPWNAYYEKELDVRFSRSYGPGRYDPNYEERGIDYPIGYVRWTERRNMASFLRLIAEERIAIDPLISSVHAFTEAEQVYQELAQGKNSGLGIVFKYADEMEPSGALPKFQEKISEEIPAPILKEGLVRVGVIGAGNYASSILLPHLVKHKDVKLKEVATTTSLSAANAARKFGFDRASTDYKALLNATDIDAVIITTRHASHATMTADALRSGKAVFVEKPLAIDLADAELVWQAVIESDNGRLMVGFNRRFSPLVKEIVKTINKTVNPLTVHYRVYAGQIELGSWYLDSSTHGSRFVGEAGHFFDVLSCIMGSRPLSVVARSLRPQNATQDDLDNVTVIVDYEDGSVGNLLYLTQGGTKVPKEYLEVFGDGRTIQLQNFENLMIFEGHKRRKLKRGRLDKGQKEAIEAFVSSVKTGSEMPISMHNILDTTLLTLAAAESSRTGKPIKLSDYWPREA